MRKVKRFLGVMISALMVVTNIPGSAWAAEIPADDFDETVIEEQGDYIEDELSEEVIVEEEAEVSEEEIADEETEISEKEIADEEAEIPEEEVIVEEETEVPEEETEVPEEETVIEEEIELPEEEVIEEEIEISEEELVAEGEEKTFEISNVLAIDSKFEFEVEGAHVVAEGSNKYALDSEEVESVVFSAKSYGGTEAVLEVDDVEFIPSSSTINVPDEAVETVFAVPAADLFNEPVGEEPVEEVVVSFSETPVNVSYSITTTGAQTGYQVYHDRSGDLDDSSFDSNFTGKAPLFGYVYLHLENIQNYVEVVDVTNGDVKSECIGNYRGFSGNPKYATYLTGRENNIEVVMKAVNHTVVSSGYNTVEKNNGVYTLLSGSDCKISVISGFKDGTVAIADDFKAVVDKKAAPEGFITLGEDGTLKVDTTKLVGENSKVRSKDAVVSFNVKDNAGEVIYSNSITLRVNKVVYPTSVKIKGIKNNTVNISVGEDYLIPISNIQFNDPLLEMETYEDYIHISCDILDEDKTCEASINGKTWFSDNVGYVVVIGGYGMDEYYNYLYKPGKAKFQFYYMDENYEKVYFGPKFTLNVTANAFAKVAPGASIVSQEVLNDKATAVNVTFKRPSSAKYLSGCFYKCTFEVKDGKNYKAVPELTTYIPYDILFYDIENECFKNQGSFEFCLENYNGKAMRMKTQLVSVTNSDYELSEDSFRLVSGTPEELIKSKVNTLTFNVLQDNVYESKLTLKRERSSFNQGETTGVLLATAKFSKNTTVKKVDVKRSYIMDSEGHRYFNSLVTDETGQKIYLNPEVNTWTWAPGPVQLVVFPLTDSDSELSSFCQTILTLKANSAGVIVNAPEKIIKKKGKESKFKVSPVFFGADGEPMEGDIKNLIGVVSEYESSPNIVGYASYKNGVVTINKKYVPSVDAYDNILVIDFFLKDVPNPYGIPEATIMVKIANETAMLDKIELVQTSDPYSVYSDGDSITSNEAFDLKAVAYDTDGKEVKTATWKSSSKNIVISTDGYIKEVNACGKATLTATFDYGCGKSVKKFNIEIAPVENELKVTYDVLPGAFDYMPKELGELSELKPGDEIENKWGNGVIVLSLYKNIDYSYFKKDYKVAISGAKKVRTYFNGYEDFYMLAPTAAKTKVTVTQGSTKNTYTFLNTGYTSKKVSLQKKSVTLYADTAKPQKQVLPINKKSLDSKVYKYFFVVSANPSALIDSNGDLNDSYMNIFQNLTCNGSIDSSKPEIEISLDQYVPAGKYKLDLITYYAKTQEDYENKICTVMPAVTFTVNVVKPKTPVAKFNSNITIEAKEDAISNGLIASVSNDGHIGEFEIGDVIVNGKSNHATQFFTLDYIKNEDGTYQAYVKFKEGADISKLTPEDCSFAFAYSLVDASGKFATDKDGFMIICTKVLKINVK